MKMYNNFAKVYDLFMNDVPYDDWLIYILDIFKKYDYRPELILDLACGTGTITNKLYEKGYDLIGIDNSPEMLAIAEEKNKNILYLNQDMREFELYGTVDSVICICDGVNYILEEEQLIKVFKLVNNYLNPGGLFIFDLNTEHKFKNILGDNVFSETFEEAAYIWENFYDEQSKINEYFTCFFIKNQNDNFYERFEECHYERAYTVSEIKNVIKRSGLVLSDIFEAFTFNKPTNNSERIYFVCRKN